MENWKQIWNREKLVDCNNLQDLINANGFETSGINEKNLIQYVDYIQTQMGITEGDSVYEVGCGSGSILFLLNQKGIRVGGLDYSDSLINIAKSIGITDDLTVNSAENLSFDVKYDYVISNSIFQYFPNHFYAEIVVDLMMAKSKRDSIAILDINDEDKREISHNLRRLAEPNYDEKYKGFEHLYFKKEFWEKLAKDRNWKLSIQDQHIEDYKNNSFRYNIFLRR
jgi:cyclopropane fatty-acyl-phospholipid synthase-like methyltransferase